MHVCGAMSMSEMGRGFGWEIKRHRERRRRGVGERLLVHMRHSKNKKYGPRLPHKETLLLTHFTHTCMHALHLHEHTHNDNTQEKAGRRRYVLLARVVIGKGRQRCTACGGVLLQVPEVGGCLQLILITWDEKPCPGCRILVFFWLLLAR